MLTLILNLFGNSDLSPSTKLIYYGSELTLIIDDFIFLELVDNFVNKQLMKNIFASCENLANAPLRHACHRFVTFIT